MSLNSVVNSKIFFRIQLTKKFKSLIINYLSLTIIKRRQGRRRVSDVERWRNAPDPQGQSDSELRNVATPRIIAGKRPKKMA